MVLLTLSLKGLGNTKVIIRKGMMDWVKQVSVLLDERG